MKKLVVTDKGIGIDDKLFEDQERVKLFLPKDDWGRSPWHEKYNPDKTMPIPPDFPEYVEVRQFQSPIWSAAVTESELFPFEWLDIDVLSGPERADSNYEYRTILRFVEKKPECKDIRINGGFDSPDCCKDPDSCQPKSLQLDKQEITRIQDDPDFKKGQRSALIELMKEDEKHGIYDELAAKGKSAIEAALAKKQESEEGVGTIGILETLNKSIELLRDRRTTTPGLGGIESLIKNATETIEQKLDSLQAESERLNALVMSSERENERLNKEVKALLAEKDSWPKERDEVLEEADKTIQALQSKLDRGIEYAENGKMDEYNYWAFEILDLLK